MLPRRNQEYHEFCNLFDRSNLPSGICFSRISLSLGSVARAMSVRMMPGAMAFAVIPHGASSRAIERVKLMIPALDADSVRQQSTVPCFPAVEEMLTMRPNLAFFIAGMTDLAKLKQPLRFMPRTLSHSSCDPPAVSCDHSSLEISQRY